MFVTTLYKWHNGNRFRRKQTTKQICRTKGLQNCGRLQETDIREQKRKIKTWTTVWGHWDAVQTAYIWNEFMMSLNFVLQNSELQMRPNPTPQQKSPKHYWTCPVICALNYFLVRTNVSNSLSPRCCKSSQIRQALKHPHSSKLHSCFHNESLTWQCKKLFTRKTEHSGV